LNNINFLKNKIKSLEDRIIIWDNNFYTCNSNRFIHQVIVAYLVLHEGLVLQTWEDIKNWYKKPDILIGLQLKEDDLLLADSHKSYDKLEKEVRIEIVKNTNHYKDIIKKIEKQTKSIYEFDYNR
jgi:hypothetical protein